MQKMRRFSNSPHGMPFHKNTMMAKNLTFVRLAINKLRHRIFIPKWGKICALTCAQIFCGYSAENSKPQL